MQEGITLEELSEVERVSFIKFEQGKSYAIPAKRKHQIVHDQNQNDIGLVFSNNGREEFRNYESERIYLFTSPYAWIIAERKQDTIVL